MSLSRETQEEIKHFAKEQSKNYLDEAEMTYIERLRKKSGQTKQKLNKKISRFKGQSDKSIEAQNDLVLYMSDYINDLISQGLSEQEALKKASEAMKFNSSSEQSMDFNEQIHKYYENQDIAVQEAFGLFFAGFMFIGLTIGGLIGFLLSGGRKEFLSGGYVDTIIGIFAGIFIGLGLAMVTNGFIMLLKKK